MSALPPRARVVTLEQIRAQLEVAAHRPPDLDLVSAGSAAWRFGSWVVSIHDSHPLWPVGRGLFGLMLARAPIADLAPTLIDAKADLAEHEAAVRFYQIAYHFNLLPLESEAAS